MAYRQFRQDTETHASVDDVARPRSIQKFRGRFSALTGWIYARARGIFVFFVRSRPDEPVIQCADREAAYLQACLAAPLFCYVSPALYSLGRDDDKCGNAGPETQPGDNT